MCDILISHRADSICWALNLEFEFSWTVFNQALAFLGLSAAILVPISFFVYGGIQVYIWIFPLASVPVIVLQSIIVLISSVFALSSSWIIVNTAATETHEIDKNSISLPGHFLRLSVFLMGLIGSSLYFWNVFAFLCGISLLWLGRKKLWEILGVFSISWTLLVQIFVYLSFWR